MLFQNANNEAPHVKFIVSFTYIGNSYTSVEGL